MTLITRADAKKAFEKTYFTGVACKNGHIAKRYTSSGTCAGCIRANNAPILDPTKKVEPVILGDGSGQLASRSDAQRVGENTYFTGVACKNGHISKRYTKSGTCAGCINGYATPEEVAAKEARKDAVANLVQVKIRCFDVDLEFIKAAAWAFGITRYPVLMMGDVYPGLLPTGDRGGAQGLYKFNVHVDDVEALRKIAQDSMAARSNGAGEAARAAVLAKLAALPIEKAPPKG
jgi:hypothetical protein